MFALAPAALAQTPSTPSDQNLPMAPTPIPVTSAPAPIPAPIASPQRPSVDIRYDSQSGPVQRPHLENVHVVYGGELTLDAGQVDADLTRKQYTVQGHVQAHEADTTLQAGEIRFDGLAQHGYTTNALLTQKVYTIRSSRIDASPDQLVVSEGDFTTAPPEEKPDYHIHAQTITLDRLQRRVYLRNASLYLFGTRLITIRRYSYILRTAGQRDPDRQTTRLPSTAVSGRYGLYFAYGGYLNYRGQKLQYRALLSTRRAQEVTLIGQQTLYVKHAPTQTPTRPKPVTLLDRIRTLATAPTRALPDGDPLRFHDFLPDPNPIRLFDQPDLGHVTLDETLAYHVASSGRLRNDLYVSRFPEIALRALVPLTPVPAAPPAGDPQAFRAVLRRPVFYADVQETIGMYHEFPTGVNERRSRTDIGFGVRPLLVAPNTVIQPNITFTSNVYGGGNTYHYQQLSFAVNHYFTDLNAVSFQLFANRINGNTPFDFDALDTSRELDIRYQRGNRRLVTAGRIRYDLARHHVIDYQIAVAPSLHGFIPVFSYNFRTQSIGLGFEVRGLTF